MPMGRNSGARVYIRGIPRPVEVITPPDEEEQVEVLLGTMRAKIPVYQLERPADSSMTLEVGGPTSPTSPTLSRPSTPGRSSPRTEVSPGRSAFRQVPGAGVYFSRQTRRRANSEIDLRGQRVEEALDKVDEVLNDASLDGSPQVRIVHGKGTGALRRAIREYLADHPLVASASPDEGPSGEGVTVVTLK